ncbi:3428_t:CDS:1, partial [Dentiscutata erythropus]
AINSLTADDFIIGGKNVICEIDKSKFKKYEDFWIVGGIEHTEKKKCFFVLTDNREAATLRNIIKQHVRERSIIYTDKWHGYSHLDSLNMKHRRVNHFKNRIERETGVHTNNIEGLWNR